MGDIKLIEMMRYPNIWDAEFKGEKVIAKYSIYDYVIENIFPHINKISDNMECNHFCKYYGIFEIDSGRAIIIEKYQCMNLYDLFEIRKDEQFIITILWQVTYAIKCLHDNKIMHNDIHCNNILVIDTDNYNEYTYNARKYRMTSKINIKVIDFEYASKDGIILNNDIKKEKYINIGLGSNTTFLYDMHYFLNSICQKKICKTEKLNNFLDRVIKKKYRGSKNRFVNDFRLRSDYQNNRDLYTPDMVLQDELFNELTEK